MYIKKVSDRFRHKWSSTIVNFIGQEGGLERKVEELEGDAISLLQRQAWAGIGRAIIVRRSSSAFLEA